MTDQSKKKNARARYVTAAAATKATVFTIVRRFPKRWEHDISADMVSKARQLHEETVYANAIYPTTPGEYEEKIAHINKAVGTLEYIATSFDELYHRDPVVMRTVTDKHGNKIEEGRHVLTERQMLRLADEIERAEKIICGVRKQVKKDFEKLRG